MIDFFTSIKRPFLDLKKLLITVILGSLTLVPIVNIATTLLLYGYGSEVAMSAMNKKTIKKLPSWTTFHDLFVRGLFVAIIDIVYTLPAIAVAVLGGGVAFAGQISGVVALSQGVDIRLLGDLISATGALIIFASIALLFVASYIIPMAVVSYSAKGNIKAAFDLKHIFDKIFRLSYFLTFIFSILYVAVLGFGVTILAALLFPIPFTPFFVFGLWVALSVISTFNMYGEVYSLK